MPNPPLPSGPSSPSTMKTAGIGLAVGLILGLGLTLKVYLSGSDALKAQVEKTDQAEATASKLASRVALLEVHLDLRRALAAKVYARTAAYDAAIAAHLGREFKGPAMPASLVVSATKAQSLRYGENPHQMAADVNVLNGFLERHAGPGNRRLERVQVHHHEINWCDVVRADG